MNNLISEKDRKQKEYLDCIETIDSKLFLGLCLRQILFNETYYCQEINGKQLIIKFLKMIFFSSISLKCELKQSDLLCVCTMNYRSDHDNYWSEIRKDAGSHDSILMDEKIENIWESFEIFSVFKKLRWYFVAKKELRGISSKKDRTYLSMQMVNRKCTLEKIKKLHLNPKAVMCFFDSSPDENVLMQYFKQQGAVTITNQHGQSLLRSFDYDRMNQSQLLNFKCDFYFAKGEMQKIQLIKAGVDSDKIKLIGCINTNHHEIVIHKLGCFGVYLDCPTFPFAEESNQCLVYMAQRIASRTGMKYFLKLHPSEKEDKYNTIADENCLAVYGKNVTLQETFEKADFCITHASATYVDVYQYGLRCFRLNTDILYPISTKEDEFQNEKEFVSKLKLWEQLDEGEQEMYIEKVRKLFDCGWKKGNVKRTIQECILQSDRHAF